VRESNRNHGETSCGLATERRLAGARAGTGGLHKFISSLRVPRDLFLANKGVVCCEGKGPGDSPSFYAAARQMRFMTGAIGRLTFQARDLPSTIQATVSRTVATMGAINPPSLWPMWGPAGFLGVNFLAGF